MSISSASDTIADTKIIFIESCTNGVIVTLLLYDYFLTLGSEIDLFWRRASIGARLVFYSLRLSILGTVVTTIVDSYVLQYDESLRPCRATYLSYVALWFFKSVVIAVVTTVRAYVATGGRWLWTAITLCLSLAGILLNAVRLSPALYISDTSPNPTPKYYQAQMQTLLVELNTTWTCWEEAELPPSVNMIVMLVVIICNNLADVVVIVAIWIRTFAVVRFQRGRHQRRRSIAWLLLRDGTIYFAALFSCNLAFALIGTLSNRLNYLYGLNSPIRLVLVSRLLINLRQASEEDIYIGSRQTSDEDEHNLSSLAMSEVSTLTFHAAGGRAPNASDPQTSIATLP